MTDNPDHPLHSQRHRLNHVSADMEFSILLSRSLDVLGYNQDMIRHRVDYWKLRKSLENNHQAVALEPIYAGSQSEGSVAFFGSDIDVMGVINNVICADNIQPFLEYRNVTLFQTDNYDTEPGYTKLKLIEIGTAEPVITESLFESNYNTTYISSEFLTTFLMKNIKNNPNIPINFMKSGPAIPINHTVIPDVVNDMVYCFKCHYPAMLQLWLRRTRRHNWPSTDNIYEISQMESHVVPVGCKGSDTYYQEWRICFTKAEIHLIHSLNNTQIQLYVILKIISKTFLKTICPEITSYIIKNIVLWMCELLPGRLFTVDQLVNRIVQALAFLKKCVAQNYLPSYMISERNMFYGRIEQGQKCELVECLSSFIEEGPVPLFYRIDKICDAMSLLYQEPQKAELYMMKRNTVEKLYLLMQIRRTFVVPQGMSEEDSDQNLKQDELYMNMAIAFLNLVLPEWREMEVENARYICNDRAITILS